MNSEQLRHGAAVRPDPRTDLSKVAAVSLAFWILKVLITTAGDLSGDALSISLGLGYARALLVVLAVFAALLAVQLRSRRFLPWLFWLLILSSSAVGAEISDSLDRALHWGDSAGIGALFACLLATLAIWFARRGSIRFAPIVGRADERFYWVVAVIANSVGSAFGDWVGDWLGRGLLGGIAVNFAVLGLLLVLGRTTRISRGALFWSAFIVTRVPF